MRTGTQNFAPAIDAEFRPPVTESNGTIITLKNAGIHPRTLYELRDEGRIEQLSRGLFRLAHVPPLGEPDLVTVAIKVPDGVLCLISALAWHKLTTQIPHEIYVAIPRNAEAPRIDDPPVRHFWFSGDAYSAGIEVHTVDDVKIRVYSRDKTLADCFEYVSAR